MGYISDSKSFKEFTKYIEKKNMITKDIITDLVIEDLTSRAERGYKKYATTLHENNHQNMLQHAYEEALDLAQYLKKEIVTINTIQDLLENHPNDTELGYAVRKIYGKK